MISLNNITVSFNGSDLLSNISFQINTKDRIGLVGKNGAGKSTLMKILAKLKEPTSGNITLSDNDTLGYLKQEMTIPDGKTVFQETGTAFEEVLRLETTMAHLSKELETREDYDSKEYEKLIHDLSDISERYFMMGGEDRDASIEKILLGLGFKREDFDKPTNAFSGGWRMRIELAKILLQSPSLLLLDEPTNHLDIDSIEWLENYLTEYKGAIVLISHDRAFLNAITTRTIEIVLGKTHDYKVSYNKYLTLRAERREQQEAAFENQRKMIADTQDFIDRFRSKATKSNQVQSRIKQLDKLDIIELDQEDLSALNIKFAPAPRSGQITVEGKDLQMAFGEKVIFNGVDIIVNRGEKVAFVGRNGEGKTTLARIIAGELTQTSGELKLGHNVNMGYFAQNQEDLMNKNLTVLETLDEVAVGDVRTKLRDILGAFLFKGDDVDKRVKVLSGGERSRLALAKLILKDYNLLLLDEPTNHMDLRSKDIMKKALKEYDGTVITVSHDREFLYGLVDKVYEFKDGKVKEYLCGIEEFLELKRINNFRELESKDKTSQKKDKQTSTKVESTPSSNTKIDKQTKVLEKSIKKLEDAITEKELEVKSIETKMYNGDLSEATIKLLETTKKELDSITSQWEQLVEQL